MNIVLLGAKGIRNIHVSMNESALKGANLL